MADSLRHEHKKIMKDKKVMAKRMLRLLASRLTAANRATKPFTLRLVVVALLIKVVVG